MSIKSLDAGTRIDEGWTTETSRDLSTGYCIYSLNMAKLWSPLSASDCLLILNIPRPFHFSELQIALLSINIVLVMLALVYLPTPETFTISFLTL